MTTPKASEAAKMRAVERGDIGPLEYHGFDVGYTEGFAEAKREAWRPIESAPRDGTLIFLVQQGFQPFAGRWIIDKPYDEGWCRTGQCGFFPDLTHWMPIPEIPAAPAPNGEGG